MIFSLLLFILKEKPWSAAMKFCNQLVIPLIQNKLDRFRSAWVVSNFIVYIKLKLNFRNDSDQIKNIYKTLNFRIIIFLYHSGVEYFIWSLSGEMTRQSSGRCATSRSLVSRQRSGGRCAPPRPILTCCDWARHISGNYLCLVKYRSFRHLYIGTLRSVQGCPPTALRMGLWSRARCLTLRPCLTCSEGTMLLVWQKWKWWPAEGYEGRGSIHLLDSLTSSLVSKE